LASEYVAGEALAVGADQWHAAIGCEVPGHAIAEREREVLTAVDEPIETEHPSVGGVPVGEPEG
jgi:hypothetical protein